MPPRTPRGQLFDTSHRHALRSKPKPKPELTGPFVANDPLGPANVGSFSALTPAGLAAAKAAREAAMRAKIQEHNAKVIAERQSAATARTTGAAVAARAGLPPQGAAPFAGVRGAQTRAPARDTFRPDLSAKVALARANLERLGQGGLLGATQQRREALAQGPAVNSVTPTLQDRDLLDPSLTQPSVRNTPAEDIAIIRSFTRPPAPPLPTRENLPPGALAPVRTQAQVGQQISGLGVGGVLPTPDFGFLSPGNLLGSAKAAGKGLLRATEVAAFGGAEPAKPGEPKRRGFGPFGVNTDPATIERAQRETQQILEGARPSLGSVPHIPIGIEAFKVGKARADVNNAFAAGKPIFLDQAVKLQPYGLGVDARRTLIAMAVKQGHRRGDAINATDQDLTAMAFNPFRYSASGFAQNAGVDIAALMAGLNIAPMTADALIRSFEQRSPAPTLQLGGALVQQIANHLIAVGDRPILENFYNQPFTTFTSNVPIARGVGNVVGKRVVGLSPTREVVLPTTSRAAVGKLGEPGYVAPFSDVRRVPASQNIFRRPLSKVSDALLAKSIPEKTQRARDLAATGIKDDVKRFWQRRAENFGRRIEAKQAEAFGRLNLREATLQVEADARHATREYLLSLRKQKTTLRDRLGWGKRVKVAPTAEDPKIRKQKISSKQTRAEALAGTAPQASTSAELVTFYSHHLDNSLKDAEAAHEQAITLAQEAQAQVAAGDLEAAAVTTKHAEAAEATALEHERVARQQKQAVTYYTNHQVDPQNLPPDQQRVANALRGASIAATDLKQLQGLMADAGALYGDIYQRAAVVHVTEAPGTELGGVRGTPAWQAVDNMMAHRSDMLLLDEKAKLAQAEKGIANPNSPAAREARGRIKFLDRLLKDLRERRAAADTRLTNASPQPPETMLEAAAQAREPSQTRRGVPDRLQAHAEAVARDAGAQPGVIRNITRAAQSALNFKRQDSLRRIGAEQKRADEMELQQKATQLAKDQADLANKQRTVRMITQAMKDPIVRRRPKETTLARAIDEVNAAQAVIDTGHFVPDLRLQALRRKIERMNANHAAIDLTAAELNKIRDQYMRPAEVQAVGDMLVKNAIHESLHRGRTAEIDRQIARAEESLAEASARHEAVAGSTAFAVTERARHRDQYIAAMREFHANQLAQGRDPFHAPLPYPGKPGKQKVVPALGTQFEEAQYTRDLHIEIIRDLEANMRTAVEAELFKRAATSPYVIPDPPRNSVVPDGFLLADAKRISSLRSTIMGTEENNSLMSEWTQDREAAIDYVPNDGKSYVLISKELHDWIREEFLTRPIDAPLLKGILNFTNSYRRWMLFTVPRTFINNAVGNPILAVMGGAGIMDYIRAYRVLKENPDLLPHTLLHKGPIHNALQQMKMTGYQSFWRNANVFHEDLGRVTVYMHHFIRYAKAEEGLKFYQQIDLASDKMVTLMKNLAEGKDPKIHEFTKFADHWFGNMVQKNKYDPLLSSAFLFHRWVGHMVHLTLWTMPLKYPGRTGILLNFSHLANDYRKKHGIWPDWAKSIIPLLPEYGNIPGFQTKEFAGSLPQAVTWGFQTQGVWPFSTPGQTFDLGTYSQPKQPLLSLMAQNVTPPIRLVLEQMIGRRLDTLEAYKNQVGQPLSGWNPRLVGNQIVAGTPVYNLLFPRTGRPDDYVGGLDDIIGNPDTLHRYSAAGLKDPSYYPATAFGAHSPIWRDLLLRGLSASGFPLRPVDAAGERTSHSAKAYLDRKFADYKHRIRIGATPLVEP